VITELKKISAGTGKMPTREYLIERGHQGLVSAIQKYHSGSRTLAKLSDLKMAQRKKGYWNRDRVLD